MRKEGRIKKGIEEIYWVSSKEELKDRIRELIFLAEDRDDDVEGGIYHCDIITKDEEGRFQYIRVSPDELRKKGALNRILQSPYVEVAMGGYSYLWIDEKVVAEEYRRWEATGDTDFPFMSAVKQALEPWMFSWIIRKLEVPLPDDTVLMCLTMGEKPPKDVYKGYALGVKPPKGKKYGYPPVR